jgi:hypothetical protein
VTPIRIDSMVSLFNGKPYVILRWGDQRGQLDPGVAREHALAVLEASASAEHDALVVAELIEGVGLSQEKAAMMLQRLRTRREAQEAGPAGA